jgi:hypothetical protein
VAPPPAPGSSAVPLIAALAAAGVATLPELEEALNRLADARSAAAGARERLAELDVGELAIALGALDRPGGERGDGRAVRVGVLGRKPRGAASERRRLRHRAAGLGPAIARAPRHRLDQAGGQPDHGAGGGSGTGAGIGRQRRASRSRTARSSRWFGT